METGYRSFVMFVHSYVYPKLLTERKCNTLNENNNLKTRRDRVVETPEQYGTLSDAAAISTFSLSLS